MKYVSIFSVTLKSAITPSFIGLIATTLPGVRPSMSFASRPTATTSPLFLFMATMEGSFTTMPFPPENTSVFAVPKSIARSDENKLNTDLRLYPFLFIPQSPRRRVLLHRRDGRNPRTSRCAVANAKQNPSSATSCFLLLHRGFAIESLYRPRLPRHHDGRLLLRSTAAAILSDHHNRVLARCQRLRKVPERTVRSDVRDRCTVNY